MTFPTLTLLFSMLIACGYSEEDYSDDYFDAACDKYTECEADMVASMVDMGLDEESAQATTDTVIEGICGAGESTDTAGGEDTASSEDTCEIDSTAAKACVSDIEAAGCDTVIDGSVFASENCTAVCG